MQRIDRYGFVLLPMLLALFFVSPLGAQDSLQQEAGTIVVRRPPVKAAYFVRVKCDYSKVAWHKKHFWESRARAYRRSYQAWLKDPFPPQPVSVAHKEGDSIRPAQDSAMMSSYALKKDRPAEPFNYEAFVAAVDYYFTWSDTMKLDSARFEYRVDTKGRVEFKPVPWAAADSSCRVFESQCIPVMRKLWLWYPAQRISNKNSELENIPCTVIVTVYAYDGGRELPPIIANSSEKKKGKR